MRKLEGIVKEIVDELEYLKRREERFQSTNREYWLYVLERTISYVSPSFDKPAGSKLRLVHLVCAHRARGMANLPLAGILQEKISHRLRSLRLLLFIIDPSRNDMIMQALFAALLSRISCPQVIIPKR